MASCKFCRSKDGKTRVGRWLGFTSDLKYMEVACRPHRKVLE